MDLAGRWATPARLLTVSLSKKTQREYPMPLLLGNVGQLLTLRTNQSGPRRGPEMKELSIIKDAAVLCHGGKIVSLGKTKDTLRDSWLKKNRRKVIEIDCLGKVVLPGFVDSHTHPA